MANFARGGFSGGFAKGRALRLQQQALDAEQQNQRQARLKSSIDGSEQATIDGISKASELIQELAKSGAIDDATEAAKQGEMLLAPHATLLDEIRVKAILSAKTPEEKQLAESLPSGPDFVDRNIGQLQQSLQLGIAQSAQNAGVQEGEGELAKMEAILGRPLTPEERARAGAGQNAPNVQNFQSPDGQRVGVDLSANDAASQVQDLIGRGFTKVGTNVVVDDPSKLNQGTTITQSRLEKSILDSSDGLARVKAIQDNFKPEFLTFQGKVKGFFSDLKDKASIDLTPEEEKFLTEYSSFAQSAFDNINRYIKEITGAQMSEFEADRLRKGIPDPERDGPTKFKAKMDQSARMLTLTRARAIYFRNNGIDVEFSKDLADETIPGDISLENMEKIINDRVAELEKELGDRGKALDQVKAEFEL